MAEHEHGSMNIRTQEETYEGFIKMMTRGGIAVIVILVLLAIVGA